MSDGPADQPAEAVPAVVAHGAVQHDGPVIAPDPQRPGGSRARRFRIRVAFWGRSLLFRVVVLTLLLSTLVMVGVGFVLQSQITSKLLEDKVNGALTELNNDTSVVQGQIGGVDSDVTSLSDAIQRAMAQLGNVSGSPTTNTQSASAGSYEAVIAATRPSAAASLTQGPIADVPADLIARVAANTVARQYTTIVRGGVTMPALVVGGPAVQTSIEPFDLFLIFPLTSEQSTVTVVQNTLLLGGAVLVVALSFIAAVVAYQAMGPVRRAAQVAGRLAAGDLAERMPVKGPVELTVLARSFNGMADALRAQIRQLEEFGRLQRRFTSDVSHELRTPVTTVRMAADLLHSSREELPPHLNRTTELLVNELDRFESLLADLLEISRHDAGMAELAAEQIDIRPLVRQTVAAAQGIADHAGVALRMHLPTEPVIADIDYRRVERVLRNLINNAVDHAEGLPVDIEVAGGEHSVAVTVTDSGIGLKPGEAGLVFNRFWRADPSRQRQTGGTGLGLAIALEDARLHGGWLQASGSPGVGARFRLTLPREQGVLIESSPLPLRIDGDGDDEGVDGDVRVVDATADAPRNELLAGDDRGVPVAVRLHSNSGETW
jgi:two-component system, OmpR family, sensor histidine kinase MtrB